MSRRFVERPARMDRGTRGRGRPPLHPWHEVEVGQSFLVPDMDQNDVASQCARMRRRWGKSYTTKAVMWEGVRYTRVLRTE